MTATIHSITDRIPGERGTDHSLGHDRAPARGAVGAADSAVVVFSSFLVSPGEASSWLPAWRMLAATAATWPGCRSFRPVRDRNDDMYVAVFSEWDDIEAYRAFMRETGDRWTQGAQGHTIMPGESRYLDVMSRQHVGEK